MSAPFSVRLAALWASLLLAACTASRAPHVRMIDAAPINSFPPWGKATLATYPSEQADMEAAVVRYLASDYEILDRHIYVASAFSRVLQSDMYDVLVKKLGGKVVDHRIPEGLGNIRIWKHGKEYFAVASSWIIYPGANAIYGYYQLRRTHEMPMDSSQ